jgi:hypothetical protein
LLLALIAILITIFVLAVTIWSVRSPSTQAESFRRRLPTLYGAIGGLGSLLLPWISFSLLPDIIPSPLLDALPLALEILANLLELTPLGIVAWLLERMTSLPGYMLFVAMPHSRPLVVWAVAAPAVAALLSLITGLIAFLTAGRPASRVAGGFQLLASVASLGLLLAAMPCLDQWGTMGDFKTGVMAVSIGTGLDFGAWVAVAALVLMVVGALSTLLEPAGYRYGTTGAGHRPAPRWR